MFPFRSALTSAALVGALLTCQAQAQDSQVDVWMLMEDMDPITDVKSSFSFVLNLNGMSFAVTCLNGNLMGLIETIEGSPSFADYQTYTLGNEVAVRIDAEPPIIADWSQLPGSTSLLTADIMPVARAILAGKEKFVFRAHGVTTETTLTDAAENIRKTMATCGVTL